MSLDKSILEFLKNCKALSLDNLDEESLIFRSEYSGRLPNPHEDIIEVFDLGNSQLLVNRYIDGEQNFMRLVTMPEGLNPGYFVAEQIGDMPVLIKNIFLSQIAPAYSDLFTLEIWENLSAIFKANESEGLTIFIRESEIPPICEFITHRSPWVKALQKALIDSDTDEIISLAGNPPR